ncbi:MAG TPA: hypothetical protein ENI62_01355 [Gammaproteobacteria bacterium]|nr:hypothetical protein [Gammaproteobacteria bacterium]
MTNAIIKQMAAHLLIGGLSVSISLVAFEGILTIALPPMEKPGAELAQIVDQSSNEAPIVVAAPPVSEKENGMQNPACSSDFYAVFDADSSQTCVRNPTPLMAQWGPPSASWFRSLGGEFHSQRADTTPSGLCACLAAQNGYQSADRAQGLNPIDQILFENTQIPITKWVCGDPCVTVAKGESHEY